MHGGGGGLLFLHSNEVRRQIRCMEQVVSRFDDLFIHGEIYGANICGDPFFPAADLARGARRRRAPRTRR
jgi:hypothetical protein